MTLKMKAIGIIHSPHIEAAGTPIQPVYAGETEGTVEIFTPFVEGLADLEGFDRIWLLYSCHRSGTPRMRVTPYRDTREHGVFATRAPSRPNAIGLSCVELIRIERHVLHIRRLDILDGAPLLDIKPYVPAFDSFPAARTGWLINDRTLPRVADGRFHDIRAENSGKTAGRTGEAAT